MPMPEAPLPRSLRGIASVGLLTVAVVVLRAAEDPAAHALEQFRAANLARAELAREEAAWRLERERLAALTAAARAEAQRLAAEADEAESQLAESERARAAIGDASDLDRLRSRLGEAGGELAQRLQALARTTVPGAVAPPAQDAGGDADFEAALRALEAAEHAAASVGLEIVTGTRGGRRETVKMLRVAGAAAWWVSLDGAAAGPARMDGGALVLEDADVAGRAAIILALAQAEGRGHADIALLPAPSGGLP